jgi:hypothetical protein
MTAKSVLFFSDMTGSKATLDVSPWSIRYPHQIHPRTLWQGELGEWIPRRNQLAVPIKYLDGMYHMHDIVNMRFAIHSISIIENEVFIAEYM